MTPKEQWKTQAEALGALIRSQRRRANLSLRQLAEMTRLSNPYLSQVERGLHQPSARVLSLISDALNVSVETLLAQAGLVRRRRADETPAPGAGSGQGMDAQGGTGQAVSVEAAIDAERRLTSEQKSALVAVYRSMLGSADSTGR